MVGQGPRRGSEVRGNREAGIVAGIQLQVSQGGPVMECEMS